MSYKFNLDHTLEIADVHDMITIDIKPETRCLVTGSDIEIHGYLAFRGSYLTPDLGEAPFDGSVPLDITLPYLGGEPDVKPEVISFDYRVINKESLTLNLEVELKGYQEANNREAIMDAWMDPVVEEPVYEEVVIEPFDFVTSSSHEAEQVFEKACHAREEALTESEIHMEVIEADHAIFVETVEDEVLEVRQEAFVDVAELEVSEEEREVFVDRVEAEAVEEQQEAFVDVVELEVLEEEREVSVDHVEAEACEEQQEAFVDVVELEVLEEEREVSVDRVEAEAVEEQQEAFVDVVELEVSEEEREVSVDRVEAEAVEEQQEAFVDVVELEVLEEEPEVSVDRVETEVFEEIPYSPLIAIEERMVDIESLAFEPVEALEAAEEPVVEVEAVSPPVAEVVHERRSPHLSESAAALMDELFAMKRGTAFKEKEKQRMRHEVTTVEKVAEPTPMKAVLKPISVKDVEPVSVKEVEVIPIEMEMENIESEEVMAKEEVAPIEKEVESIEKRPPVIHMDSVAQQFADGETTIKMIYVKEETVTLGGILERYTATLDDVWNLSALANGVSVGDCVMLRYEKTL
ncbi:MAG: hypothetical protein FWG67_07115 [Defluviitaleaceae bacterium]|nr:hypothetical protein [Defluviitaleaceae bacterium]